jgi:uncharacterized membrane protein YhaH (DUF805 family)
MDGEGAGGQRLVAVVLGSVLAAVVAGGLAGALGYAASASDGGGQFEDLGRAIVAVLVAAVVGVVVFVGAVAVGVRRAVPAGRRLRTWVTIVLAAAAVFVLLGWITETARRAGLAVLGPPVAALLVVAAVRAIGGAAGIVPARRVWPLVGATAVALAVLSVAEGMRGDEVAAQQRVARYERNGAPLALVNGTDLDARFAGWELHNVDGGYGSGEVGIDYELVDPLGYGWISLDLEADPEPIDCAPDGCEEVGRRTDGRPIMGRRRVGTDGRVSYSDVWVDVDGGRWSVAGSGTELELGSAVEVLRALEAVDAEAFEAGIGSVSGG